MKLLPARCLLALAAVTDVALHARGTPVTAKGLAERHGLVSRHFETLLQDLAHAGILKAYRGPRGGYELARERRRITAGEIVRAVSGDDPDAKPKRRPTLVAQVIEPAVATATAAMLAELDLITVDTLCRQAEAGAEAMRGGVDFTI